MDACVLAESSDADLYLRLAEKPRLLLPKWTDRIWDEVDRTCTEKLKWESDLVRHRRNTLNAFFGEAMVRGYEHWEDQCTNAEGDRHVLAAAIHAKVDTIVTANLKHFPGEALEPWGIIAPASFSQAIKSTFQSTSTGFFQRANTEAASKLEKQRRGPGAKPNRSFNGQHDVFANSRAINVRQGWGAMDKAPRY